MNYLLSDRHLSTMITLTSFLSERDAPFFLDISEETSATSFDHGVFTKPYNIYCESSSPNNRRSFFPLHPPPLHHPIKKIFLKHNHKAIKRQVTPNFLSKDMIIRLTYRMCSICTKRSSASLSTSLHNLSVIQPNAILSIFNMLALYVAVFGSATVLAGYVTRDWKTAICEYLPSRR
jgi:hypothetical protein